MKRPAITTRKSSGPTRSRRFSARNDAAAYRREAVAAIGRNSGAIHIFPMTELARHHEAQGPSDHIALGITRFLRFLADSFFARRYGHRAIVLETVAAVPGMVGGMMNHLKSLRRMREDEGWIRELLDEAENERMHLMAFVAL